MAVSASAAQAKWLLLRNGVSVLKLDLKANILLARIVLPELGAEIHCTAGTGTMAASLSGDHKALSASMTATLTGCTDLIGKACTVSSKGQPAGTIVVSGTGVGGMTGEEYFVDLASEEFAFVEYHGALCPFDEVEDTLSGEMRIDLPNALADTTSKTAYLLGKGLSYWGSEAFLAGSKGEPISMHLTEVVGASWGMHLVGL
jgi:hypothetical protein